MREERQTPPQETNSLPAKEQRRNSVSPWIPIAALAVSFVGFVDATYLTLKHFLGSPVTCSLLEGCEVVTTSEFSAIGPIPISLFGSLYYLAVFLLVFAYRDTGRIALFRLAAFFSTAGFLVSLILLYLQAFVLEAFCLYCLISLATSTVLFMLMLVMWRKLR